MRKQLSRLASLIPVTESKVSLSYKAWRFLRAAALPSGEAHLSWNGTWLPRDAAMLVLDEPTRAKVLRALPMVAAQHDLDESMNMDELQNMDITEYLPNDILTKTDRMGMAHGLEIRSPFLDTDLSEWIAGQPSQLKVSAKGRLKVLLRSAARRIYGPEISERPKRGFSIPVHQWVRGAFSETARDLLSRDSIRRTGLLDADRVQAIVEAHFSKTKSYGFEIWGLCVLMAWHRLRIERPPSPPRKSRLIERTFALRQGT